MTTDGGGWTAVIAGRNGQANYEDGLDSPSYAGACPDPATRCVRRAPASLADSAAEVAVSCGSSMVGIALTEAVRRFFVSGTQVGWATTTPRLLSGPMPPFLPGWTAVFSGRNGEPNVFERFDSPSYMGVCPDPATRCLRRAPASASAATELAVSCAGAMVSFPMTPATRALLTSATQSGWVPLAPTILVGPVANAPNSLWKGMGTDRSFVFAQDNQGFEKTFALSAVKGTGFDYCNGLFDQASMVQVFYR